MAELNKPMGGHRTTAEVVGPGPLEAQAGADLRLRLRVACSAGCDLRGQIARIVDRDGARVLESPLIVFDGTANETGELTVGVPKTVGDCGWRAEFLTEGDAAIRHETTASPVPLVVQPHKVSLAVWDLPSPVVVSRLSQVKVGVRCSAGCPLAGREIEIRDETGNRVSGAKLDATVFPGTDSLYWAEADLVAPAAPGKYDMTAALRPTNLEFPHQEASWKFLLIAVQPPEHSVTVQVVEKDTHTPVANAEVRSSVYRAQSDETGSAKLELPRGVHDFSIWKPGYETLSESLEVTRNIKIQVEVETAPEPVEEYWM